MLTFKTEIKFKISKLFPKLHKHSISSKLKWMHSLAFKRHCCLHIAHLPPGPGYPNAQWSVTVCSQRLPWGLLSLNSEKCSIMFCDNLFLMADTTLTVIFFLVMVHLVSLRPQHLLKIKSHEGFTIIEHQSDLQPTPKHHPIWPNWSM